MKCLRKNKKGRFGGGLMMGEGVWGFIEIGGMESRGRRWWYESGARLFWKVLRKWRFSSEFSELFKGGV